MCALRLLTDLFRIFNYGCLVEIKACDIFQLGCSHSFSLNRCSEVLVFFGFFFFPASSPLGYAPAWMLSHCDCLISHRCRCRCYITRLPDSLGDKLLPKKHSRCELRCTDAMGELKEFRGDWIVYGSTLSFSFPLGNRASFMSARLFLWPNLEVTNGACSGSLPPDNAANFKRIDLKTLSTDEDFFFSLNIWKIWDLHFLSAYLSIVFFPPLFPRKLTRRLFA